MAKKKKKKNHFILDNDLKTSHSFCYILIMDVFIRQAGEGDKKILASMQKLKDKNKEEK